MNKNILIPTLVLAFSSTSMGFFDPGSDIGREKKIFTSTANNSEVCVLPKHLELADDQFTTNETYSKEDFEKEEKLCSLDFHANTSVICPKFSSTSAATHVYEIRPTELVDNDNGKNKFQNAESCFNLGQKEPKRADTDITFPERFSKFKQNESKNPLTPKNISAPLAYYHLSRALGNILKVPVAVLRTMDVEKHRELIPIFNSIPKKSKGTTLGWDGFDKLHNGPRNDSGLYTVDKKQIYGVILKGGGTDWASKLDEMAKIMETKFYKKTVTAEPMQEQFFAADTESMRRKEILLSTDFADMVLLDTLLEQMDRYSGGNIDQYFVYWNGKEYLSQKKYDKLKEKAANDGEKFVEPLKITRLSIQDNDAGLLNYKPSIEKNVKNWNRLSTIKHFSPSTYFRLQKLAKLDKSQLISFLMTEALLTSAQATQVFNNIQKAAKEMKAACLNESIFVDLDVDMILKNQADKEFSKQNCMKL